MEKKKQFREFKRSLNMALKTAGLPGVNFGYQYYADRGFVHFSIESWNTWKMTLRAKDSRYIGEGRQLDGNGLSSEELQVRIIAEVTAWQEHIKLHDSIDRKHQFIVGKTVVEHDGEYGYGIYEVTFDKPCTDKPFNTSGLKATRKVLEHSPRDAAQYAWSYIGDEAKPVKVAYLGKYTE